MGQGRLFRVVGWDEQTGTHLLLSVPGVEEDTPWEQYVQVRRELPLLFFDRFFVFVCYIPLVHDAYYCC